MTFADKLKNLMKELNLTQSKLSDLTGISKPNISQYIHGKHEPSKERKREIANALGVQEDYFEMFLPVVEMQDDGIIDLPVNIAAKLLHRSEDFVKDGLKQGQFPWGYAVKMKKWRFLINGKKFSEIEGVQIPIK